MDAEPVGAGVVPRQPETAREAPIPELSVVIPVFNEARVVAEVVRGWVSALDRLGVRYELLVYDDGSTDETPAILHRLAESSPRLTVRTHGNRGHGATVLRGYREARGEWVFQADGDGELGAEGFPALWRERHDRDLVLGLRQRREGTWDRRMVSRLSALTVRALFGVRIGDANVPFRLMRRVCLERLLAELPKALFAPNVALSGVAALRRLRIAEVPVPHRGRRAGRGSLAGGRIWWAAARSFGQTVAVALRARRRRGA